MPDEVIQGKPYTVVVTGPSRKVLLPGRKRGTFDTFDDTSPLRVTYLTPRLAREGAPALAEHLADAPGSTVELPDGTTTSLREWVKPDWQPQPAAATAEPSAPPENTPETAAPTESEPE